MPDGSKLTGVDVIRRYVELLTGSPATSLCWRFLPEKGNTEAEVVAYEKAEREKLKAASDRDWKKFSLKRNFDGALDDVIDAMREHQKQGWGIFTVANEGGRDSASITKIRALFIDLDDAEWRKIAWHVEPDFIVARDDTHAHVYWLVGDCPVDQFTTAQLRLIKFYGSDPAVHDLPRVLRVPGTRHMKDPKHARVLKLIEMREMWEPKRSVGALMAGLPELDPEELKRHKSGSSAGDPITEKVLLATLAEIPSDDLRRADWKDVVGGIRATNLVGDTDGERRRAIAHAWMKKGGHPIGNYDDAEGIDQVFDGMPPRDGGLGYGSLHHLAQKHNPDFKINPHAPTDPNETFEPYLKRQQTEQAEAREKKPSKFLLRSSDVIAMPDPAYLVEGFLIQGEDITLVSAPKTGKTFTALDIGLSIAANLPVFGRLKVRRPGAVVYLSGEGHAGMKRRLLSWYITRGVIPDPALWREEQGKLDRIPFFYKADVPLVTTKTDATGYSYNLAEIVKYITGIQDSAGVEVVLVIIDTMARAMGSENENASEAGNAYLQMTQGFRTALGCTTLSLAHCPKDAKGDDIDIRGTGTLRAGMDAVWAMQMNEQNRIVKLWPRWLKDAEGLGPFAFRLRNVIVPGLELNKGAVLELVNPKEFDRKPGTIEERRNKWHWLEDQLRRLNCTSLETAIETGRLAERLGVARMTTAYPDPPDSPKAERDEWTREARAHVDEVEKMLRNGSSRSHLDAKGQSCLYNGLYRYTRKSPADPRAKIWWFASPEDDNQDAS